ncbi:MAG TPA: hypothetical protein VGM86_12070 [Thermoanaerobaculia bacterium]|jgi:hypothetical protein
MKKRLTVYLSLVAGMALLCLGIGYLNSAQAQSTPPPPGSYTLTCTNITFTGTPGKTPLTLSATCKKANGGTQQTTLKYDIANCNGTLKWAPNGC